MTGPTADAVPVPRIRRLHLPPLVPPLRQPGEQRPLRSMHLNESPFAPAPAVVQAMCRAAMSANRYPDHDGQELVAALSQRLDVGAGRIVVGAGSNELLYISGEIALDPGDEGIAPDPGFITYSKVMAQRAAVHVGVPVRTDGKLDVEATLKAVTPRTRLVFVATPNNPTGGMLTQEEVARLIAEMPDHVLLHYDDAYFEFARQAGGCDALPLLQRRRGPWIITRTFSKAYCLSGARVGYGICSTPALADAYRGVRITFSVNTMALAGALAALDEANYMADLLDYTANERKRFGNALSTLSLNALPSTANFIMVITPRPALEIAAALRQQNILVLPLPWRDAPGALRITIGSREDNDAVTDALRRIMDVP